MGFIQCFLAMCAIDKFTQKGKLLQPSQMYLTIINIALPHKIEFLSYCFLDMVVGGLKMDLNLANKINEI